MGNLHGGLLIYGSDVLLHPVHCTDFMQVFPPHFSPHFPLKGQGNEITNFFATVFRDPAERQPVAANGPGRIGLLP
jgi:hypothetical protein